MTRCLHQCRCLSLSARIEIAAFIYDFQLLASLVRLRLLCECYYMQNRRLFSINRLIKQDFHHARRVNTEISTSAISPFRISRVVLPCFFFLPLSGEVRFGGLSLGPTRAKLVARIAQLELGVSGKNSSAFSEKKIQFFNIFHVKGCSH